MSKEKLELLKNLTNEEIELVVNVLNYVKESNENVVNPFTVDFEKNEIVYCIDSCGDIVKCRIKEYDKSDMKDAIEQGNIFADVKWAESEVKQRKIIQELKILAWESRRH